MSKGMHRVLEEFGIKNIVNYLRKSRQDEEREKKTGEDTLHEQKQLMDRVLTSYGIPFDQEPEIGSGDKISSRPVFQKVLQALKNGKYDAIAVKEISRMGRGSYTDMGTIFDLITEKRIFIITPYKIYDPTNPSDLRQIRFELFLSREEFETTRERLTGGRVNAAMEGKWVSGAAPFGYQYDSSTKRLVIKEEEAEIVRAIFDYYANGIVINGKRKLVQFRALASYLTRIGIKTIKGKAEWAPITVKRMLQNDRYIGVLRFRTNQTTADGRRIPRPESEHIVVEDAHEPIIDMETWERVQDRIEGRDTTSPNNTKLEFDPCELAGLCVCNVCGRKMIRQYSIQHYKKQDGSTNTYHKEFLWCKTTGCTFVKYRNVEEDLLEVLRYLADLDNSTLLDQLNAITNQKVETTNRDEIKKHIEQKNAELNRRMEFIYEKYESGIYTDEVFLERKAAIEKEIADMENVQIEEDPAESVEDLNADEVRSNISSVLEAYENSTHKSDRNAILREVFDHVVVEVLEKGRGRKQAIHQITPYLKFDFVAKR